MVEVLGSGEVSIGASSGVGKGTQQSGDEHAVLGATSFERVKMTSSGEEMSVAVGLAVVAGVFVVSRFADSQWFTVCRLAVRTIGREAEQGERRAEIRSRSQGEAEVTERWVTGTRGRDSSRVSLAVIWACVGGQFEA